MDSSVAKHDQELPGWGREERERRRNTKKVKINFKNLNGITGSDDNAIPEIKYIRGKAVDCT